MYAIIRVLFLVNLEKYPMKSYSTIEQRIDILQSRIETYKEEIAVF